MTRSWKNILQWPIEKKPAIKFEEYVILVDVPDSTDRIEMVLKVNNCTWDFDSTPIVYLNDDDITHNIVGLVYCSVNKHSLDEESVDHAYLLTDTGIVRMRGIKRHSEARNGFSGSDLPLWHLYRSAELNCQVSPESLRDNARECMDDLKAYCDCVYSGDHKDYEFSSNIGAFVRP